MTRKEDEFFNDLVNKLIFGPADDERIERVMLMMAQVVMENEENKRRHLESINNEVDITRRIRVM